MVKEGRSINIYLSDSEYSHLVDLARKNKQSLSAYMKSIIQRSLRITMDVHQSKENETEREWPILILTKE